MTLHCLFRFALHPDESVFAQTSFLCSKQRNSCPPKIDTKKEKKDKLQRIFKEALSMGPSSSAAVEGDSPELLPPQSLLQFSSRLPASPPSSTDSECATDMWYYINVRYQGKAATDKIWKRKKEQQQEKKERAAKRKRREKHNKRDSTTKCLFTQYYCDNSQIV